MAGKTIRELRVLAQQAADATPSGPDTVVAAIRAAMPDADPFLLVGVLIEGIAVTIAEQMPPQRQPEAIAACAMMLRDRLRVNKAI